MYKIAIYLLLSIVGFIYLIVDLLHNKFSFKGFFILASIIVTTTCLIYSFIERKKSK